MPLPMMGSKAATVLDVGQTSVHGQLSIALRFRLDGDDQVNQGSVAREMAPLDLKSGDRVQLEFVLGNIMRVSRL